MQVEIADDEAGLARLAAERVLGAAQREQGTFALALSGGSTPRRLYSLLASGEFAGRMPWMRTHIFFADERAVPPDHPDSNFGMADDLLLSRVPLPPDHVHRMEGEAEDLDAAARRYEAALSAICPPRAPGRTPVLGVVLLGIGDDGHTASLFPGTAALEEGNRWVAANYVPRLGVARLTLTRPVLTAAEHLLFVVSGEGKLPIVRRLLLGDEGIPAAQVAAGARSALVLVDRAAAPAESVGRLAAEGGRTR
jgi:6-phosphogluconolactonase